MRQVRTERILVVDDELAIRQICQRLLGSEGCQVFVACSGDQAVEELQKQEVDMVLTDITMPGSLDGSQLLEIIKQRSPSTDVIMMTAFPSLSTAIPTLKEGAYDYLIKPFDNTTLLSVVKRCFEKRRLSEELNRERILRQELSAAYTELQKVEEIKEAFFARLSHELRTPFTPILFTVDQIQTEVLDPKVQSLISKLRLRVKGLWELIEDLLIFTNLQKKEISFFKMSVSIPELLKQTIANYRVEWEEKQVAVDLVAATDVPPVQADAALLQTMFKHLFLNAIRFNKKGGQVHIEVNFKENQVGVIFDDTGIGIPPEKCARIFDNFYQVADYMTRQVGGLGLGLAIVRHIAEAHGGQVSVSNRKLGGSRFTVVIPIGKRSLIHA